ncbi:MAG TPA: hemerythrin domain-containing protein [Acidimicrobiales bacterium]
MSDESTYKSSLETLAYSAVPFDLFREVHKGLRFAIFRAIERAGSVDHANEVERGDFVSMVDATVVLLREHHRHEDDFVRPLLLSLDEPLARQVDSGHEEINEYLEQIEVRAAELAGSNGDDAVRRGLELYLLLTRFAALYITHLLLEEGDVMARLRGLVSLRQLFELEMAIRTGISPETMCDFIAVMAPAMNPDERSNMLVGMRDGAPPEIYEQFRAATAASLDPSEYAAVAARIAR